MRATRNIAKLIHDRGGHLLELINGVLDMSKIEAGKFELYQGGVRSRGCKLVLATFRQAGGGAGGVSLTHRIAPEASHIFGDRRAIKQILVNLLSNGIKFTPRGGAVVLEARVNDEGVEIMVRDSGIGIARSDLEKLGKPFAQAEHAAMRAKEGTGLGLALVKSLAIMHGGQMILELALGIGTTVKVQLPFAVLGADGKGPAIHGEILRGAA